jgi:serine/threonine-protein kinase
MSTFISELQRRNVHRAAIFYGGGAWLLVQVATQVFPFFHISEGLVRAIVLVAMALFPFAMLFSWFYEWTPEGIKRESEVERAASITAQTGKQLDRWIIAVLGLAVVVLLADKFLLPRVMREPEEASIAVLPMANSTGDASNEYISDGVSEDLIATLSRLSDIKVIGRTSSFKFRKTEDDSKTIGEKLGVSYLLEGSVQKSGERVRVEVSLIKAADGSSIWAQTFDREFSDIFAVQSEISGTVAKQLKVSLVGNNAQTIALPSPNAPSNDNPAAYTALLQGNYYATRNNPADVRKGIGFFEEAIRLDPNYAMAHARLSYASNFLVSVYGDFKDAAEAEQLKQAARSEAAKAMALDPNLPEAHLALGQVQQLIDSDLVRAGQEYARAAQLGPNNHRVLNILYQFQVILGQYTAGLATARHMIELDPLDGSGYNSQGHALLMLGRYDEAETSIQKALELQPNSVAATGGLVSLRILRGKGAEALELAKGIKSPMVRANCLAMAEFAAGDQAAADAALKQFIAMGPGNESGVALIYALRQEPDAMFDWLERAWSGHDPGVLGIRGSLFFLRYKDDPRYLAFGRKVGVIGPDETP